MLFKAGSILSTVSGQRTILAKANIKENIPKDFGIFDLNNFLSVLSLFKDGAELSFDEKNVIFNNKNSSIQYRFASEEMIYDEKNRELINAGKVPPVNKDVSFVLTQEDFEWLLKTANVLASPNISVESDGNSVKLVCCDVKNDSCNKHYMDLPDVDCGGKSFSLVFKSETLKIIPKTYNVDISFSGISKFTDADDILTYWIALEAKNV